MSEAEILVRLRALMAQAEELIGKLEDDQGLDLALANVLDCLEDRVAVYRNRKQV